MEFKHKSVLLYETVDELNIKPMAYMLTELLAAADIHTKSQEDFPRVED